MIGILDDVRVADRYGPWVLIVGGCEGIGRIFAELLVAKGVRLLLVARSAAAAAQLYGLELAGLPGKR